MSEFKVRKQKDGFTVVLWRGENMCLIGLNVDKPEDDLVGFAIECCAPGSAAFEPLLNRLAFSYPNSAALDVTGARKFPSTQAPFQKFRWIHFPNIPAAGTYRYRCTKMHMPGPGDNLTKGTAIELDIDLDPVTHQGFVDIGFTRNFASSQAFIEKFPAGANMDDIGRKIIPASADDGLSFKKFPDPNLYDWLGFEAKRLIFEFLDQAVNDPTIHIDAFAYDFNEPEILEKMEALGNRLRIIIDDSTSTNKQGKKKGHGMPDSAESQAANRLIASAGNDNVHRIHFDSLQHNKVFIAKRNGAAFACTAGSTNFSYRGLYIQANNVLVFRDPRVAELFATVFNTAFDSPNTFKKADVARQWITVGGNGKPTVRLCFSPHSSSDISLNPVKGAIELASTSVLYSIAFLNQIRSGPTKEALDRLMTRPLFSYGTVDEAGSLSLQKPDGTRGLVDFSFLADHSPEPFKSEWSGSKGINIHHKFVVVDFNLPTAKVFTGSSNLAPSGEQGNGDHLLLIEDQQVATSYAIEAIRVFDHLHFRDKMKEAKDTKSVPTSLTLRKPPAMTGQSAWWSSAYVEGSQRKADRLLFSS